MRIALVHDWLTGMRGGEYVLESIAEVFPNSDLFTLIHIPGKVSAQLEALTIHTSWLQKLPDAENRYRFFLPLMPHAIRRFDLSGFDLILSSSHCVAKGVNKRKDAVHVSYIHAPMRYMWDRYDDYFGPGRARLPVRVAARALRPAFRSWDFRTAQASKIDLLIANSEFIAKSISQFYGRSAEVVHPFADLNRFKRVRRVGDFYLMVGAFAPNKRVDLAIDAFNKLKLPLKIVGSGQEEQGLRAAAGPTIEFLGAIGNAAIADLFSQAKAFIFPGKEDFGITPLEAMAAGTPVVAFGEGGIRDTVLPDETGVFFDEQTVESLCAAVLRIETDLVRIDPDACRRRAHEFSKERFQREYLQAVKKAWSAAGKNIAELDDAVASGMLHRDHSV